MVLYIFDNSEQLQAMISKYAVILGVNSFYFSDPIHAEDLQGVNTFSFNVPANHEDAQYIKEGYYVGFYDLDNIFQLFEIKEIKEDHNGSGLIKNVYAESCYYEILDDILEDIRPANCAAAFALNKALTGSRWQLEM
jgi:phage minor structural protein